MLPKRQVLGLLFAGLVCAGIIGAATVGIVGAVRERSRTADPAGEPVLSLHGHDLLEDYLANEIAADQQYKGKTIEVVGRVTSVSETTVSLRTSFGNEAPRADSILCRVAPDAVQNFTAIQAGQDAAVVGVCLGARKWEGVPGYGETVVTLDQCRPGDLNRAIQRMRR